MPSPLRDSRMARLASTCESRFPKGVALASGSYNKSKRNVRELALLCQIASSVSRWHREWVSSLQRSEACMTFVRPARRVLIAAASMSALFVAAACGGGGGARRRRWNVGRRS